MKTEDRRRKIEDRRLETGDRSWGRQPLVPGAESDPGSEVRRMGEKIKLSELRASASQRWKPRTPRFSGSAVKKQKTPKYRSTAGFWY